MIGSLLDGRYKIVKPLGSGGFARTYLAQDTRIPKHPYCVVKKLHPSENNPEMAAIATRLFKAEAETLAELGAHPQIPQLYAYFSQCDDFYLVQEFIDGRELEEEMSLPWTFEALQDFLIQLLQILEFVHSKGVIHRDIKPQNILRRNRDNQFVLIDFGAIKEVSQAALKNSALLTPSVAVGTSGYMSPEQGQGKPRPSSDIYSLGIIAMEIITGKRLKDIPENKKTGELLWKHLVPYDTPLVQIIDKMTQYLIKDRYSSAEEVLHDLYKIEAGDSILIGGSEASYDPYAHTMVTTQAQLPVVDDTPEIAPQVLRLATIAYASGQDKFLLGDRSGAEQDFEKALQLNPCLRPDIAEFCNQQGEKKLGEGNYHEAIEDFSVALQFQPKFALAYCNRGDARCAEGKHRNAIYDYSQAIKCDSNYTPAYWKRGNAKLCMEDFAGATSDFSQALQLDPKCAIAYSGRARVKYAQQDYHGSLHDFSQAIRHDPSNAQFWFDRGTAKYELQDYQGAIADYDPAIEIDPRFGDAYCNRGLCKIHMGDEQGGMLDLLYALRLFQEAQDEAKSEIVQQWLDHIRS
jgi:serine/threonine protein kinase/Tfp pilus assembly protein PilF